MIEKSGNRPECLAGCCSLIIIIIIIIIICGVGLSP
jgi:hypothetical protein